MLCCSLAFCPGAEAASAEPESETQWLIVPRVEVNPYAALKKGGMSGLDFANTSLYTLFEGGIGDSNFSYSFEGHLMSVDPELKSLYQNAFNSQEATFVDWAKLTYTVGQWDFNVGKDVLPIGTFEFDEYDFDSHYNFNSNLWNYLSVYQWGGSVGYTTADEANHFTAMFSSSPFGMHPFSKEWYEERPLYGYSLGYRGEFESFSALAAANMFEYEPGAFVYATSVGVKVPVSDSFTFGADFMSRGYDNPTLFGQEGTALATLTYEPSDSFSVTLKGGYEFSKDEDVFGFIDDTEQFVPTSLALLNRLQDKNFAFGGVAVHWYPMDNLRLHGVVATNNYSHSLSINVGAIYYFDLFNLFR